MSSLRRPWLLLVPVLSSLLLIGVLLLPAPQRGSARQAGLGEVSKGPKISRVPAHPLPVTTPSDHLARIRERLDVLDGEFRRRGGEGSADLRKQLDALNTSDPATLHEMEAAVLDRTRSGPFRGEMLRKIAGNPDPAARRFVLDTLLDRGEDPVVRRTACDLAAGFRSAEAFDALHSVYRDEPEFPGRTLLIPLLAATRDPRALPVVRGALSAQEPLDARALAAGAMEVFAEDAGVRDELRALALQDRHVAVRLNALGVLCRGGGADVEPLLRSLTSDASVPAVVRSTAEAWLKKEEKRK